MKVYKIYGQKQQPITRMDTPQLQHKSVSYTSELLRIEWIYLDARHFLKRNVL
jgi:hypothetical protein